MQTISHFISHLLILLIFNNTFISLGTVKIFRLTVLVINICLTLISRLANLRKGVDVNPPMFPKATKPPTAKKVAPAQQQARNKEKPLLRRKSELPYDETTIRALSDHKRPNEFLTVNQELASSTWA